MVLQISAKRAKAKLKEKAAAAAHFAEQHTIDLLSHAKHGDEVPARWSTGGSSRG